MGDSLTRDVSIYARGNYAPRKDARKLRSAGRIPQARIAEILVQLKGEERRNAVALVRLMASGEACAADRLLASLLCETPDRQEPTKPDE